MFAYMICYAGFIIPPIKGRPSWVHFPMPCQLYEFLQRGCCEQALCRHRALLTNPLGCFFPPVLSSLLTYIISTP